MSAYASGARTDGVFDRARAKVSIADYLERESVKLKRAGADLRGPCVLCDGGTTKFAVLGRHKHLKFRCYGCEAHGDVVDLAAAHRRMEPLDAARWLLGEDIPASAAVVERSAPDPTRPGGPSPSDKVALEMLREAQPFAGSLAERYLVGRGIAPEVVALAAPRLRYHASAKHHWDDRARAWVRAPAMVAAVVVAGPDGELVPTGGVHCTYLDRATGGKARLEPAKLMWGPQHLDGRPGGAWLIGPQGRGDLVVAEGIETALSVAALGRRKHRELRACAALSLNRLQGGAVRDDDGCLDPFDPQPDPAVPAFAWPLPAGSAWGEVLVAVDADMKAVKVRVRTGRGKPCDMRLTGEARARICGRLAVAAWRAAGAPHVRAIAPPPGLDFNDELRRLARSGAA